MNRMYGSEGQIKMDPTGAGGITAVAVASMNAWTLNMARDKADVTAFGDPNKVYVQGKPDIKGTIGGWFDTDDVAIFAPDARTRKDALCALRRSWASFGLELHDGKTGLFDDPAAGDLSARTASDARPRAPRCDNRAT